LRYEFEGGRHRWRVNKILKIEKRHMRLRTRR
jgi:hypothetical protein